MGFIVGASSFRREGPAGFCANSLFIKFLESRSINMKVAKLTFALVVVALMAGSALAQNPDQPRQGRGGRGPGGFGGGDPAGMFERLAGAIQKLDLTAEQKEKVEALKKEYAPKVKAVKEKMDGVLTADQKSAREAAVKAAREAKGDDRRAAYQKIREAVKLTDDQKKAMEPIMKDAQTLSQEVRTKFNALLTEEQKTKLRESMGRGPRGGGANRST